MTRKCMYVSVFAFLRDSVLCIVRGDGTAEEETKQNDRKQRDRSPSKTAQCTCQARAVGFDRRTGKEDGSSNTCLNFASRVTGTLLFT